MCTHNYPITVNKVIFSYKNVYNVSVIANVNIPWTKMGEVESPFKSLAALNFTKHSN